MIQSLEDLKKVHEACKAMHNARCTIYQRVGNDADFESWLDETIAPFTEIQWLITKKVGYIEPWRVLDATVTFQAPIDDKNFPDGNYDMDPLIEAEFPHGIADSEFGQGFFYINQSWADNVVRFIKGKGGVAQITLADQGAEYAITPPINWTEDLKPTGFVRKAVTA